jgi:hypothetical protein
MKDLYRASNALDGQLQPQHHLRGHCKSSEFALNPYANYTYRQHELPSLLSEEYCRAHASAAEFSKHLAALDDYSKEKWKTEILTRAPLLLTSLRGS